MESTGYLDIILFLIKHDKSKHTIRRCYWHNAIM